MISHGWCVVAGRLCPCLRGSGFLKWCPPRRYHRSDVVAGPAALPWTLVAALFLCVYSTTFSTSAFFLTSKNRFLSVFICRIIRFQRHVCEVCLFWCPFSGSTSVMSLFLQKTQNQPSWNSCSTWTTPISTMSSLKTLSPSRPASNKKVHLIHGQRV